MNGGLSKVKNRNVLVSTTLEQMNMFVHECASSNLKVEDIIVICLKWLLTYVPLLCLFLHLQILFGGEFLDIPYWKFCGLFFEDDNGFIIVQVIVNPTLALAWLEHQALLSVFYHRWSLAHADTIECIDWGHHQCLILLIMTSFSCFKNLKERSRGFHESARLGTCAKT